MRRGLLHELELSFVRLEIRREVHVPAPSTLRVPDIVGDCLVARWYQIAARRARCGGRVVVPPRRAARSCCTREWLTAPMSIA
jgi:hypothetical protein